MTYPHLCITSVWVGHNFTIRGVDIEMLGLLCVCTGDWNSCVRHSDLPADGSIHQPSGYHITHSGGPTLPLGLLYFDWSGRDHDLHWISRLL